MSPKESPVIKLEALKPAYNIKFYNNQGIVGTLWFDGPLRFGGDAEESARVFFEHFLKQLVDAYLEERHGLAKTT